MRGLRNWISCLTLAIGALWPVPSPAQGNAWWKPSEQTIQVSFSTAVARRAPKFTERGFCYEQPLRFAAVKNDSTLVVAAFPEPGQFEIDPPAAAARVEMKNVRAEGREGKAEFVRTLKTSGPKALAQKARADVNELLADKIKQGREKANKLKPRELAAYLRDKGFDVPSDDKQFHGAYARAWAIEQSADLAREKLEQLAADRPKWVTTKDKSAWKGTGGRDLWRPYEELLVCDRADRMLRDLGFEYETGKSNYQHLLEAKTQGVHLIVSGESSGKPLEGEKIANLLSSAEINKLKELLYCDLNCRFYPQTDADDPNSQWFNAQHVACVASGVSVTQVNGTLDPAKHDRVDWWILDRYKPGMLIDFSKQSNVQADPPYTDGQKTLLRVVATGESVVDYSFEIRNESKTDGLRVLIHESPNIAKATFPF